MRDGESGRPEGNSGFGGETGGSRGNMCSVAALCTVESTEFAATPPVEEVTEFTVKKLEGPGLNSSGNNSPAASASTGPSGPDSNHCDICGAWFKRKYEARRHIESVHLRIRPFKCNQCSREFSRKCQMRDHVLATHEKPKEFSCHICPAVFQSKYSAERHVKGVHMKMKRFSCEVCGSLHFQKSDLNKHQRAMHREYAISINSLVQPNRSEVLNNPEQGGTAVPMARNPGTDS